MIFSNAQNLVYAEGDEHSKPLNENASSLSVSLNVDGAEIKSGETVEVNYSQSLEMNIAWNFANGEYPQSTEDKLTYQIPANIHATDSSGPLMDGNVQVGTYTITNNTITIQYNDENFIHGDGRKGTLRLSGSFDNSQLNDGQGGQTSYEFPGAGTITVKMKRNDANDGVSIKKTGGQVNKDNDGNLYADFIVAIHSKGDNTNVVFSDSMGSYMTLNGTVSFFSDEACNTLVQPQPMSTTVANSTFAYTISKMNDNETIYAKYRVNVDKKFTYNDDCVAKTNKASVKSEEHDSETSKEIQLQISDDLKYPKISKEGKKEADGVIAWTINFGKAGYDISGLKLKDILKTEASDDYLASQFKKDSFTVSPAVDGLTFDSLTSENGFTMPEGSNGEYTITYQTTYTQPTDSTKNYKVNNTITEYPYGDKWEYSKDSKNVTVSEKYDYVQKDFISFDEKSREALWKVTVHVPETGIADLKVADEIPDGMEFVNDSLSDLSKGVKTLTISENKEKNKVYFLFGNVTKGTISFTYKTKITTVPEKDTTYNNKVRVYENDKKLGTDEAEYELKFKQYLSKDADWNTFKVEGNDVSTSIPWVLTVSKLPADAKNVVITDTLPSNLKMVENSLMIKENWSNIIDSSNVDVELTKTSTGNVINFKLSDNLIELAKSKDIQIFFNTTYEDLSKVPSGSIEYKNTAQIKVDDYTAPAVSASRWQQYNSKDILNKDGVYNDGESFIHYTISVNKSSADLNPNGDTLTLEDTIGSEIDFQLGTLKINGASATADQYSYDDTTRKITITIPDNQYAKITYDGYPNIAIGEEFTSASNNKVVLKGVDHVSPADKSFDKIKVHQSSGTSTYNGVSLTVYKQEKGVSAKALKGAKFALYEVTVDEGKETDAKLVSEKITGDSGYVSFSGLSRSVLYKLVETQAPDGYFLDSTPNYLMFKDATRATGLITQIKVGEKEYNVNLIDSKVYNKQIIVEDEPVTKAGSLKLTKHFAGLNDNQIDSLKQKISFDVQKKGSSDATHINLNDPGWEKSNGTYSYTLTNLQIGDYTVTETNASLKNYTVSTVYTYSVDGKESKQVSTQSTISVEDGKVTTLNITNTYEKQTTSYSVQKVWSDNENAAKKRPSEITVQLQRKLSTEENYSNVGNVITLNNKNNWEYIWGALDATDQSGNSYTYQAVEVGLVNGYISSSVNDGNKTTINNTITSVNVSKVDISSLQELEGAHIQVLDGNKVVEEWNSTSETHKVCGLETNKLYTLHETIAPDGYTLASDIPFKLDDNGHVVVTDSNQNSISENGSILLKDALTSIRILKVDATTNTPLAGAHIQIKDGETIVQEFNSTEDNAGIQINGLKTGVVYTLHESSAPANYTLATDTTFSLNADGSINLEKTNTDFEINNGSIVLSVKDVQISKTTYSVQKEWDDNNNALNNRPSTIQVQLQSKLGDGEFTNDGGAITLSQDNNWTYTWNDLPSSNDEGTKYTYQAVEVGKSENYLDPSYRYDDSKKIHVITNKSYPVVEISKTNVLGDEIQSAVLTLVDTNKNEVARWTSGSETNEDGTIKPHYVQVAPGTYTLHEEATPDNNYVLAQDITFTVNENGVVTMNDTVVDHVTMVDEYNTHLINVSKVDISGNEIAGASMKITGTPTGSESKITPIEWVSGSDGNNEDGTLKNHVVSLQPGNYTLEETAVPDGNVYVKAANINFTVNVDGTVKVADNEAGDTVTMVDYYSDHGIVISKQDVNGAAVKGALLKLFDKENNEIASWETDGITDHQVEVQPGTYTLHEEATPDNNYVLAQNITFTVNEKGKALINGKEVEKVVMVDTFAPHDVVISKTDLNGKELKGAKLEVTGVEEGGGEIEKISWISDGNTKNISVKPGTYTLHEEATPDNNYVLAQDITFKVDSEGTISVDGKPVERVTMVDDYNNHPVEISKTDVGGKELAGAQLSVVDTNGITIDSWTSSAKIHKVTVKPGTYTLHEDLSPVGYKIAKDITFDVDIEGKVTVNGKKVDQVVMVDEDQTYDIAISKQDITNNKELPGAKLSLKDTKTNKVVETWTSASEAHVVTVVPSTYELSEVASPNGYEIAEKITFTVERDGTITIDGKKVETVIMQDQPTKPTVDTSDHNNIVFFGITGVISLGLAFMMLLTRKKIH